MWIPVMFFSAHIVHAKGWRAGEAGQPCWVEKIIYFQLTVGLFADIYRICLALDESVSVHASSSEDEGDVLVL